MLLSMLEQQKIVVTKNNKKTNKQINLVEVAGVEPASKKRDV